MISSVQGVGSLIIQDSSESVNINLKNDDTDQTRTQNLNAANESAKSATEMKKNRNKDSYSFSELAEGLNDLLKSEDFKVELSKDKATDKMVFKVIDNKTSQILNQIPKEIELKISKYVTRQLEGGEYTNAKVWFFFDSAKFSWTMEK